MNIRISILLCMTILCNRAYAESDSTFINTGIGINAGELINIFQDEMNMRLILEQRILKNTTLLIEPGIYFSGRGYNLRLELKRYLNFPKQLAPLNYIGIAYYHKQHNYSPKEIFYTDSTHSTVGDARPVYAEKTISTIDLVIGCVHRHKYYYTDVYIGAGVRFKNISGITVPSYDLMEDNPGRVSLMPGTHIFPNLAFGCRIGRELKHRR